MQHTLSPEVSRHASHMVLDMARPALPCGGVDISGRQDHGQVLEMVRAAFAGGITCFETAQGHENSEELLGECLSQLGRLPGKLEETDAGRAISQLTPEFSGQTGELTSALGMALARTGVPKLESFLLTNEDQLSLFTGQVLEEGKSLLRSGLLKGFGVSLDTPAAAWQALEHPLVSALQVPASLLDRRFESAGVFDRAKGLNKRLYIRPDIPQGLLCLEPDNLPEGFGQLRPAIESYRQLCAEYSYSPEGLALAWLFEYYPQAYIVFGAANAEQVRACLAALPVGPLPAPVLERIGQLFSGQAVGYC